MASNAERNRCKHGAEQRDRWHGVKRAQHGRGIAEGEGTGRPAQTGR